MSFLNDWVKTSFICRVVGMGKIIRDERYENTIWCLCNNYEEYLQFARDLFLYKGIDVWGTFCKKERWIDNEYEWSELFGVDARSGEDGKNGEYWEKPVDPINDSYDMKEKPKSEEYPVIVHYDNYHKNVLWMSLEKLKGSG